MVSRGGALNRSAGSCRRHLRPAERKRRCLKSEIDQRSPSSPEREASRKAGETQPDDEHVAQFSEGNEKLPHDEEDVGRFSEGQEELPNEEREGQFSDSVEEEDA